MRWWPQSLSGRLAIILVGGMLAAQALTGTVWFDMRYGKALEIPTRLAATRLADTLSIVNAATPAARPALLRALSGAGLQLQTIAAPDAQPALMDHNQAAAARLFEQVFHQRNNVVPDLQVTSIAIDDGDNGSLRTMLLEAYPSGRFVIQASLADHSWLQAELHEGQAGMSMAPLAAMGDYLLRIYVLRGAVIVLLAWLAVRLAMKPLQRLATAAEQLGHNIHSPPLDTAGPQEVRTASLAFNAMQRRLIDNIAERTRFLAAVSHDLRSPITRMRLRTEIAVPAEQQARFRKDLDEMDALIGATLQLVQDSDVHEELQLVDINSLLTSLRLDFGEIGAQVEVHGQAAPLPGYAQSLKRCLQNIVENAVRYGEQAAVRVEDSAETLCIVVTDRGPGISEDQLDKVMEPFYRLEQSRNTSTGGYGLGLNIAQTVARAHHGQLNLRNLPQGGLEVRLQLQRQRNATATLN
ncbi:HAMP domain-containing protein [Duganella sp. FT80W]|uniref:histidine kinase n=2 Tax=Duganella guangzhouensis TaxID=2666084 RepID=A0A6I2KWJ0_9BURK|nr:HAMP domain-containing protein [Duganella guangzhouensis]